MTWLQPPEDADVDVDVTGVRAVLAGLPDPGPMPADVSARILELLAQARGSEDSGPLGESAAGAEGRDADWASSAADDDGLEALGLGDVVTLDEVAVRRRGAGRPRWLVLGSAAAGVAAIAVAGTLLFQGTRQPSLASVQSRSGVAAPDSTPGSAADTLTGKATIVFTGTAYTSATLARLAEDLVADQTTPAAAVPSAPTGTATALPIASPAGLAACLATLGEDDADRVAADVATFNGAPAVVIVSVKDGLKQVYAVDPGCNHGDPMILLGPLPMT